MSGYVARRLGQALLVLFIASAGAFAVLRLVPGDPAALQAGLEARPEAVEAIREKLGLNDPIPVAYSKWITGVAQGEFGESFVTKGPVADRIKGVYVPTIVLVMSSLAVGVVIGIVVGTIGAVSRRESVRVGVTGIVSVLYGVPPFWIGLIAILVFSLYLGWLPTGGYVSFAEDPVEAIKSLVMPVAVLAMMLGSVLARFVQAALQRVLSEDYVRTARAKGVPYHRVIRRHALRTALIPIITVIGLQFGALLGGSVIIESVFTWPGMGRLLVEALGARDYPTVQACLFLLVVGFALVNLATDLLYGFVDPRVREQITQ
jgi:ABC-type dipeptide/oligopeptide/nickel transport system permease component